jgi:hypothetical protein
MIHHLILRALVPFCLLGAVPAYAGCQCADIGDIKNRMLEANTAIQAYSTEMQKMVEQMMRTQEPLPYTPERRAKLQGRVQAALNQAMAGKLATAPAPSGENPGGTSNLCTVTINVHPSTTACIRESVAKHEEYHQAQCMKTRTAGKILESVRTGKDRFERDDASLPEYAQEEIAGYTAELQFLQAELMRLSQSEECKPKQRKPELRDYTAQPRR